ncbi:hypothetical protein ACFQGT_16295 [Natrialbaceae archaeon GCM10025810]|uniref:hypothetical protein n=1 Tax=Halovalidus salilacus TaxID=3075124 RepID=UPI0036198D21
MNRRTVLRTGATLAVVGAAGCLEGVEEHFTGSVASPIELRIVSEADRPYEVLLEAYSTEEGNDNQTYEEAINLQPGERAVPGRLRGTPQRFQATRFGEDREDEDDALVETTQITEDTRYVHVTVYDDDLELEVSERNGGANETGQNETEDANEDENGSAGDNETDDE